MTSFAPSAALPGLAAADPSKHVNYTLGMILGVDDFTQEFAYLSGRDRWLARDVIGYGTVDGLAVSIDPGAEGHTVVVSAGAAISPSGQLICVDTTQCAQLNEWLDSERAEVEARLGRGGETAELPLYVVLSYRVCETDEIPIPGDPCRTEAELTAASRLQDSFRLALALDPPEQREEDRIVDFVGWLRDVEVVGEEPWTPIEEFLTWIRAAAEVGEHASPPGAEPSLEFLHSSPPETLAIPRAYVHEYLKAAFLLWTTELRPHARDAGARCGDLDPDQADEVLLARLDLDVLWEGRWQLAEEGHGVDQAARPYVNSLRTLQEWLLAGQDVLTGPPGPPGTPGEPGQSVTEITVATVAPDVPASSEYDEGTGKLHLNLPKGAKGSGIRTVTAAGVAPDEPAEATYDQATESLLLKIPKGSPGVSDASAESVDPPAEAEATLDESSGNIHFKIPRGLPGANIKTVTVVAGAPGSAPATEFDEESGTLTFTLPPGPAGPPGTSVATASATTLPSGRPAEATFDGTTGELHLGIPTGPQGAPGPKGDTGDPGPLIDVEPWHLIGADGEPDFENGWRNYGEGWESAAFYRDPWGRVYVRGLVAGGELDAVAFRLPEGYRPPEGIHLVGNSDFRAADAINVHPDGAVYIRGEGSGVSPVWVSLAHVNFRAEK